MMPELKVVEIESSAVFDVPASLRKLADNIEAGDFGSAYNLAWVIDCGNGRIELGVLGKLAEVSPTAYMLFGLAKHRIETYALKE